jgi:hypothetical protein
MKLQPNRAVALLVILMSVHTLPGCGTYEERMARVRGAYEDGNYGFCDVELRQLEEIDARNRLLYNLERGVLQLALGQPREGERILLEASRELESEDANGFTEWTRAALLDDRQLDYAGEDYEKILIRVLLTLANVVGDGRDAEAYANSVLERQLEIMAEFSDEDGHKPKEEYKLVAMGAYVRGILAEESPLKTDVALREFQRVAELEPDYTFIEQDLERVKNGKHSAKGNGVIHILALVGRGPFKVEVEEETSATALGIAQLIWALHRDRITFPTISSIKIPALAFHADNPETLEVIVDGGATGTTATVTDVEATAEQHFEAMRDYIVARAIVRRVFKIVVTEATQEIVDGAVYGRRTSHTYRHRRRHYDSDVGRSFLQLGISLLGALWSGVERADTRAWSLLPASFQVLRLEVPAGEHTLRLRPLGPGSSGDAVQELRVGVRDGYNTYVVAVAPTLHRVPLPLTSEPVETLRPGPTTETAEEAEPLQAAR